MTTVLEAAVGLLVGVLLVAGGLYGVVGDFQPNDTRRVVALLLFGLGALMFAAAILELAAI